jgi:hypothetical protein
MNTTSCEAERLLKYYILKTCIIAFQVIRRKLYHLGLWEKKFDIDLFIV